MWLQCPKYTVSRTLLKSFSGWQTKTFKLLFKINNIAKSWVTHSFPWHHSKGSNHKDVWKILQKPHIFQYEGEWLRLHSDFLVEMRSPMWTKWPARAEEDMSGVSIDWNVFGNVNEVLRSQHIYNLTVLKRKTARLFGLLSLWGSGSNVRTKKRVGRRSSGEILAPAKFTSIIISNDIKSI